MEWLLVGELQNSQFMHRCRRTIRKKLGRQEGEWNYKTSSLGLGLRFLKTNCQIRAASVPKPSPHSSSFQAKFLIPMAITISGGLISATAIILLVLPCLLLIFSDIGVLLRTLWSGRVAERAEPSRTIGSES